jgi:hypothetical protein
MAERRDERGVQLEPRRLFRSAARRPIKYRTKSSDRHDCGTRGTVMAKGKKKKVDKPRRYRDARTGRFVTKKFAKKHPKKTLRAW